MEDITGSDNKHEKGVRNKKKWMSIMTCILGKISDKCF